MKRLLDLFCGAGGSAVGYHRAGFEVVGVDHLPQKNYPFEFHLANAMTYPLEGFDVIHASPPCQRCSAMQRANVIRQDHPNLVAATRCRPKGSGAGWVVETVPGAPPTPGRSAEPFPLVVPQRRRRHARRLGCFPDGPSLRVLGFHGLTSLRSYTLYLTCKVKGGPAFFPDPARPRPSACSTPPGPHRRLCPLTVA